MRIIYFGGRYLPSSKVNEDLEKIQDWYNETAISILIDCKYDQYQYIIRKQQLADRLRSKWKLIQGGKAFTDLKEVS